MSTIIFPAEAVFLHLAGHRITNFPATGTFISIAKVTPNSVMTEGLNDTVTHSRHKSRAHRVTVTIMAGHPDDVWLNTAAELQSDTNTVLEASLAWGTNAYVSVNCSLLHPDTRDLAADGLANVAYMFEGTFPGATVAQFVQPATLTAAQIEAAIPA
jgi:hypothetical protein